MIQKEIKRLREKANVTQKELAKLTGLNLTTIKYVDAEYRTGNLDTIETMLDALGYELKIAPKGMFKSNILEFTKDMPKMVVDKESPALTATFGEILKSNERMIVCVDGSLVFSKIYKYQDGIIQTEDDPGNIEGWMEAPKWVE